MPNVNIPMKLPLKLNIERESIEDLLCGALEGGSNYWYMIVDRKEPNPKPEFLHEYPMRGGSLTFVDLEDSDDLDNPEIKKFVLDKATMIKGMQQMAAKYPGHFADFQQENTDANTFDCFLQCCLFGEEIYG